MSWFEPARARYFEEKAISDGDDDDDDDVHYSGVEGQLRNVSHCKIEGYNKKQN